MKRFAPLIFTIAILASTLLPFSATLTANRAYADNTTSVNTTYTPPQDVQGYLEECSIKTFIPGCLEQLIYYIPYTFGSWAMSVAAEAFDAAANLTLSSTLYTTGSNFLEKGWTVTRDFANIFFILILLFIAFSLVLDIEIGHANPKKMLTSVILVAILINFSFFATEVVIDISNSMALVFYNQISVVNESGGAVNNDDVNKQLKDTNNQYINASAVKPLSVALVKAFTPQVFSNPAFYEKLKKVGSSGFFNSSSKVVNTSDKIEAMVIIPIMLMVGMMFLVVAYSFIVALISLLGRLIGLWIAIVFAPLAFVSMIVPSTKEISGFGWNDWSSSLLTNAFAAPIYFFFLLLISLLTQISIVPKTIPDSLSPGILLVLVIIQFAIVMTMLLKATSYVKKAAGEIGNMVMKGAQVLVGGAAGLAAGTALGAVALGGQATVGFVGKRISQSGMLNKWASGEGGGGKFGRALKQFTGENVLKGSQFLSKSSFDARHTGVANALSSATGIGLGSFGALAAAKTAGGLEAAAARKAEKDEKFANSLRQNSAQEAELKKLKGAREKELDEKEAEQKLQQKLKENIDAEVRTQETIRREASELMKNLNAQGIKPGDKRYDDAQKAFDEALVKLNDGPSALKKQAEDARKAAQKIKEEADAIKLGKRNADGTQIKATEGETKADGTTVTKKEADSGKIISKDSLSLSDLEKLVENSKKAPARAYLAYQAETSGYHTNVTRDKLGNVTGFHVDTSQPGERNWARAGMRVFGAAALGGLTGNIGLLTTAVSGIGGAVTFGVAAAMRDVLAEMGGGKTGSSIVAGEAAHHTAEPGGKHEHEHGVYHSPNKDFFDQLKSIFTGGGGGGGGSKPAAAAHH